MDKQELSLTITEDGSSTLYNHSKQEHYHSIHGAVQESVHVFINAGLQHMLKSRQKLSILEIGFGTGLNALLTLDFVLTFNSQADSSVSFKTTTLSSESNIAELEYTGVEPLTIDSDLVQKLDYTNYLHNGLLEESFMKMHLLASGESILVNQVFQFRKLITKFQDNKFEGNKFDLVYFDAFSPVVEPDLWTLGVFKSLYEIMNPGGVIVTYCSKGAVRRTMQECGFKTERLPGPPGKHEMLRATK
jgi:tRNA U34 5-methylaminomethyl-2-thiouridine-forming methyltransferase MnmC